MKENDHLIVVRMVDAPVDFHIVPGLLWALDTYGSGHELAQLIAMLFASTRGGVIAVLMMPPGADLNIVLEENYEAIKRQVPESSVTFVPFDLEDCNDMLDWIDEHELRGMSVIIPAF